MWDVRFGIGHGEVIADLKPEMALHDNMDDPISHISHSEIKTLPNGVSQGLFQRNRLEFKKFIEGFFIAGTAL